MEYIRERYVLRVNPFDNIENMPIATRIIGYCGRDKDTVPNTGVGAVNRPVGAPELFEEVIEPEFTKQFRLLFDKTFTWPQGGADPGSRSKPLYYCWTHCRSVKEKFRPVEVGGVVSYNNVSQ